MAVWFSRTERKSHPIVLDYEDADYEYERGAGGDRIIIPPEIRLLVAARQLKVCAVCTDSLKLGFGIDDLFDFEGYKKAWIEHIIPKTYHGTCDVWNLAYTCHYCNRRKGKMIGFWPIWQAFRRGETIEGYEFYPEYLRFVSMWERNKVLPCQWPYWAREKDGTPIFFGWDGENMDRRLSFKKELAIFRKNIHQCLKISWNSEMKIVELINRYLQIPTQERKNEYA